MRFVSAVHPTARFAGALSAVSLFSRAVLLSTFLLFPKVAANSQSPSDANGTLAAQLALRSESLRTENPAALDTSALIAAESLILHPAPDGDHALRSALALLRKPFTTIKHEKTINAVALSRDGLWIGTAGDDEARISAVATGTALATLHHSERVTNVMFSPDSRLAVTASDPDATLFSEVKVLDLSDKDKKDLPSLHVSGSVVSLAVANHDIVAVGTSNNVAMVFNARTGREIAHVDRKDGLRAVALDVEGELLATAGGKIVRVSKVANTSDFRDFPHQGTVQTMAFSPRETMAVNQREPLLLTGSTDKTARLFNAQTGSAVGPLLHHSDSVDLAAFSSDGNAFATWSKDGMVHVFLVASECRELSRIPGQETVTSLALVSNGNIVVTAHSDRTVRAFDSRSGRELARMVNTEPVLGMAASDRPMPTVASASGTIANAVEITRGHHVSRLSDHRVGNAAFSDNGKIAVSEGAIIHIFGMDGGMVNPIPKPDSTVTFLAYSPDARFIATVKQNVNTQIVSVLDRGIPGPMAQSADLNNGDSKSVVAMSFSKDNTLLAVAGNSADVQSQHQAYVQTLDPATLKPIGSPRTRSGDALCVAISQDKKYMALGTSWKAYVFSREQKSPHEFLPGERIRAIAFSPNGNLIAIGTERGFLHVFTMADGRPVLSAVKHDSSVVSIRFGDDNTTLVTLTSNGDLSIFDMASKVQTGKLPHASTKAFTLGAKGLVTLSSDEEGLFLQTHFLRSGDLIQQACSTLTHNLPSAEWRAYLGRNDYQNPCPGLQ